MVILIVVAALTLFAFLMLDNNRAAKTVAAIGHQIQESCHPCHETARKFYFAVLVESQLLSWYFYAFAAMVLLWEGVQPVYRMPRLFSVSFFHDCIWFLLDASFIGILLPVYHGFLFRFYHYHLAFLRVDMSRWPVAGQIFLALLAADFVRWFHHLARHKVLLFWYFHTIHHSQRDLGPFTDSRVHPVERLVENAISFIPFLSFGTEVTLASFVGYYTFGYWHARFYHSNIKTNLGILRYILVTPQSHRIHHSVKKEHRDKNFGAMFSIWDHLFGTQYRNYDEYPETGIDDVSFPHETELTWPSTLRTLLLQLVYPFELGLRSLTEIGAPKQAV